MQKRILFSLILFGIFISALVYAQNIGVCMSVYDPVCGSDNNNYGNECEAKQAGANVVCKGECPCKEEIGKEEVDKEEIDKEAGLNNGGKNWFARFIGFIKGLFNQEAKYSPSESEESKLSNSDLGYIVKLKDPSLLSLEESGDVAMSPDESKSKKTSLTKKTLIDNHKTSKSKIISKIKSKSKISGKAIDEISEEVVLGDYVNAFNGFALNISREDAVEISKLNEVEKVYPNLRVNISLMDSVPLIDADDVWKIQSNGINITGKGIKIAIVDTGVDYTHPDLGGCLGKNCKVVGGYDVINYDDDPMDDHGHGTHCAGIAAGNGKLKGVAPDAKIYAYKVLNEWGSGSFAGVMFGIELATDPNLDGDFSDRADIISMSLGADCGGYSEECGPNDPLSQAVDNAVNAGVVAVIAAGNSGPGEGTIGSPGTARKAITVGATFKKDYEGDYWKYWGVDNPRKDETTPFSSRGSVLGKTFGLIKPDVVAPGAFICSAKYNPPMDEDSEEGYSEEEDNNCFDDRHVAFSGTSMATPHVAGAAALIKQAHSDWNAEEIKMALRSSAKDSGYGINLQGYGRIQALKAVNMQKPPIAEISTSGEVSGVVDIIGKVEGDFSDYELYLYSEINFKDEKLLIKKKEKPDKSVLLNSFDFSMWNNGLYTLKLIVNGKNNLKVEDRAIIKVNNLYITKIGENLNYLGNGNYNVYGEIKTKYNKYWVEYSNNIYSNKNWVKICESKETSNNNVLCNINTGQLSNGIYYFRPVVDNGKKIIYGEPVEAVIIKELLEGWPILLSDYPKGYANVIKENNKIKLIIPDYEQCFSDSLKGKSNGSLVSNNGLVKTAKSNSLGVLNVSRISKSRDISSKSVVWCSGDSLSIYDYSGKLEKLIKLKDKKGEETYVPADISPSVFEDKDKGKDNEYLAIMPERFGYQLVESEEEFKPLYTYAGLIDIKGKYVEKWSEKWHLGEPLVIVENMLFNLVNNWYIAEERAEDFTYLSLNAFDRLGNILFGFPVNISFSSENINPCMMYMRYPRILKDKFGNTELAVIAGNEYSLDYHYANSTLYLDIYSIDGHLKKRIYLLKNDARSVYSLDFVTGDLNNDGVADEIFIDIGLIDTKKFDKNYMDVESYIALSLMINNTLDVVQLAETKGFLPQNSIIAEFNNKNYVVELLGDTWPTLGSKLRVLDTNSGKITLDIGVLPTLAYAGEFVIAGDVDSDNEQELIVNYVSRDYYFGDSGFLIYNFNGKLENYIKTPNMLGGTMPILTDFNGDRKIELIEQSFSMSNPDKLGTIIYALSLGGGYNKDKLSWPMMGHDPQHTFCYDCKETSESSEEKFLSVQVINNDDKLPIKGANIEIYQKNKLIAKKMTSSSEFVKISGLDYTDSGDCIINVSAEGFASLSDKMPCSLLKDNKIYALQKMKNLGVFVRGTYKTKVGKSYKTEYKPLKNAEVKVYGDDNKLLATQKTDSSGKVQFSGLAPLKKGYYYNLAISAKGFSSAKEKLHYQTNSLNVILK